MHMVGQQMLLLDFRLFLRRKSPKTSPSALRNS